MKRALAWLCFLLSMLLAAQIVYQDAATPKPVARHYSFPHYVPALKPTGD